MKAFAKLFIVGVVWAAARTPSAVAGIHWMAHNAGVAVWSTGQQAPGSEAERRQASDQWPMRPGAAKPTTPSQRFTPGRLNNEAPPTANRAVMHMSDVGLNSFTDDNKARAVKFLENGRSALKQGKINEAIAWRQKAVSTGASFAPNEYSPVELARELQQAGVDSSRLATAPPAASVTPEDIARSGLERLPSIGSLGAPPSMGMMPAGSNPNLQAAKAEAMSLAARARAALDQGNLDLAKQLITQSEALRVPDTAFTANDLRPWEVALQVDSAISRRQNVVPAANFEPVPRSGLGEPRGQYPVTQGIYDANRDTTRNTQAQGQSALRATDEPARLSNQNQRNSSGVAYYEQGLQALAAGDRAGAIAAFQEAWRYQQELPLETRQQLKDKLVALTQSNAVQPRSGAEPAPLEEVTSQQQLQYQKLYREIAAEEQLAEKMTQSDPKTALQKMNALRERVNAADVDAAAKKQLLTFVDRSISRLETYMDQNKGDIQLNQRNNQILTNIAQDNKRKFEVDDTIAGKVDEWNKLVEQERFHEAEMIARQVRELAPENPISKTLTMNSTMRRRVEEQTRIKDDKERLVYGTLTEVEKSSKPFDEGEGIMQFRPVKEWTELSNTRQERLRESQRRLSPGEIQINESLKKPVDVRFDNRPLKEVLETLGNLTGVNVFLDASGLAAEGVTTDTPVTINLSQPIQLKSALNVILHPLRLKYVIEHEVLHITSDQVKGANAYTKTYYVADLVVPIPNFAPSYNVGLPAAIREAHQTLGYGGASQLLSSGPLAIAQTENANLGASVLGQAASYSQPQRGSRPMSANGLFPGNLGGAALADFDTLIELITQTIAPDSWVDAGGTGAIEPFPTNLSLVISQTQDVHDQIADLLEQLRRLQDLQVAIEVRFITLRDNFFERIGIDFDFQIDDNVLQIRRDDQGPSMSIGLDNAGNPTADLDFSFSQESFGAAIAPFGGAPVTAATFGAAILSDIEAFFVIQAAQGDRRSNVLTAPKVTLFNGQLASVNDTSQRPFVIGLIPVVGDFAVAHQPVVTVLNEGTQLGVQAVISSDRRFVRLTLVPFFSQIGDVETFTFSGTTSTDTGTNVVDPNGKATGSKDNETVTRSGTTIQLPTFSFTTVSTTVSVPDGGTILLGGIKRLSEGRNEFGVPGLSKLPYINRLFKNVGIGRDTSSLMLMVTPRIIIQEEEETKLGVNLP